MEEDLDMDGKRIQVVVMSWWRYNVMVKTLERRVIYLCWEFLSISTLISHLVIRKMEREQILRTGGNIDEGTYSILVITLVKSYSNVNE